MNLDDKVVVVGAGPAGLSLSISISRHDVVVFEEHSRVGIPKHCAGFVSSSVYEWFKKISSPQILDRCYEEIEIHTPRGDFRLNLKGRSVCRVNRPTLEEKLYEKALAKGVEVVFNTKVKPSGRVGEIAVKAYSARPKYVVAADGVFSWFRRRYFNVDSRFLYGFQWIYRTKDAGDEAIHVIFNETFPEFFMWTAPVMDREVLVGYGSRFYVKPEYIMKIVEKTVKASLSTPIDFYGGLIAAGKMIPKPVVDNVFFIGDSGYAVKPYTGGGLFHVSKLTPPLALSIDLETPSIYIKVWRSMRAVNRFEYVLVEVSRKIGYWIPAYIVAQILKVDPRGVNENIYDQHSRLVPKILLYAPLVPLGGLVDALKGLLRTRPQRID